MERSILALLSLIMIVNGNPVITRQSLLQQESQEMFCANLLNFNNYYYSLDEQKNISGIPADISVHWKTGNIFFTLINEEMKMNLQVLRSSGELETIKVAGLGQSTTVDNLNDIVYLATDNGVYKYKDDGSIELYTALGEDVMYVAVSSDGQVMYIVTWPQNRVHKITNDGQKQDTFPAIPNGHGLTVDTRNNIYFVATKTSYILKSGYNVAMKIKGLPSDKMTGVFVSRSDDVFAMDENSNFYLIDPDNASAKHLGSFGVNGVNSFALNSADDVLIGVKGSILNFNAYEGSPCKNFTKFQPVTPKKVKSHPTSQERRDSTGLAEFDVTKSSPNENKNPEHSKYFNDPTVDTNIHAGQGLDHTEDSGETTETITMSEQYTSSSSQKYVDAKKALESLRKQQRILERQQALQFRKRKREHNEYVTVTNSEAAEFESTTGSPNESISPEHFKYNNDPTVDTSKHAGQDLDHTEESVETTETITMTEENTSTTNQKYGDAKRALDMIREQERIIERQQALEFRKKKREHITQVTEMSTEANESQTPAKPPARARKQVSGKKGKRHSKKRRNKKTTTTTTTEAAEEEDEEER